MLSQIRFLVIVSFSIFVFSGAYNQYLPWNAAKGMITSQVAVEVSSEEEPGVYSSYKVDVPPRILNYEEVREYIGYPEVAKNAGIQGRIVLKVLVNENGHYVRHEVEEDFHPLLRIPCETLVPYLQFEPASHDQKKVSCWMSVPFNFDLPSYGK